MPGLIELLLNTLSIEVLESGIPCDSDDTETAVTSDDDAPDTTSGDSDTGTESTVDEPDKEATDSHKSDKGCNVSHLGARTGTGYWAGQIQDLLWAGHRTY